jgi:RNA polymerase sigma-70 factor, ECF subfamily
MDKKGTIEKWFLQYGDMVKSFIVYYTGKVDVDDLVQDVFIKAYIQYDSFQGSSLPKTWLFSIARNTAIDQVRRQSSLKRILDKFKGEFYTQNSPEELILNDELKQVLYKKVNTLRSPQREVVILRGIMQLSVKETSDVLNLKEKQISVIYHRALKKLKASFGEGESYFESHK